MITVEIRGLRSREDGDATIHYFKEGLVPPPLLTILEPKIRKRKTRFLF